VARKNDVKEVSDGYARNFLFPRGLAKSATEQVLKTHTQEREQQEKRQSEEYQKYKVLADALKTKVLNFKVKIGEKGRAFGSVTIVKIQEALKKQGVSVEREWILLDKSLKTTGEEKVKIKFPHDIIGEIRIIIEAE